MEMMICDSIKSLGQYIASPLAISETLNVKPYADISPSKVSFNILHEVYLNYHPLNPPSTPILNNKKYSEREQLKEIKQGGCLKVKRLHHCNAMYPSNPLNELQLSKLLFKRFNEPLSK